MLFRSTSFVLVLLLVLFSCSEDVQEPENVGYEYFPLKMGNWISYQVDSVVHDDPSGIHDRYTYQVKELVDSSFIDNEGELAYILKRFKRPDESFPWVLSDVWTTKRNNSRAEKVEENMRYVRLTFPVREQKSWDTNAENTHEMWDSEVVGVNNLFTINGEVFEDVCEVSMIDSKSAIDVKCGVQIYAADIGLVYYQLDTLDFNTFIDVENGWADSLIQFGREFKMVYLDHGVE